MWNVTVVYKDGDGRTGRANGFRSAVAAVAEVLGDVPAIEVDWEGEEVSSIYSVDQIYSFVVTPIKDEQQRS